MGKEMEERIKQLRAAREKAALGGGPEKVEKQHQRGKLTARERLDVLLDPGSFVELNMLVGHLAGNPGDGIVAGHGTIDGRVVCVYSQDPTVLGGSIGALHGYKMYRTVERAIEMRVPMIGLHDSPGARAQRLGESGADSGAMSEKSGASVFFPNTQASGVVPQIGGIMGSCAGISVYSPALMDFIFMVDGASHMFITGPRIVKTVTGEDITMDDLGGAQVHAQVSGVCDLRTPSEEECLKSMRRLLSFLPQSHDEEPPHVDSGDDPKRMLDGLEKFVPDDPEKSYDMHHVITQVVDSGDFFELKPEFAPEMIVGFGRLAGQVVGIVANQPMVYGGALTVDSSDKQARFMRTCDAFNIPIILLVDTPAYAPGSEQEHAGIIRHGAKVLYALCEATVPRLGVMLRKCYGGGNLGMGVVPGLGTDFVFAWPIVEMGVMGAKETVQLFYGAEILKAEDPQKELEAKIKEYRDRYANPIHLASLSTHLEDIIEPRETRKRLIEALTLLKGKRVERVTKRHGNIPL
ncbi:MAG: acyl-CoA carboxylase subunit beta [Chloroflexota bacterium]|nr:acyl-CoA carboxylase subunit beta [Chloroflexota bacterium]